MRKNQVISYSLATIMIIFSLGALGPAMMIPGVVAEQGDFSLEFDLDDSVVAHNTDYKFTFTLNGEVSEDVGIVLTFPQDVGYDFDQINGIGIVDMTHVDTDGSAITDPCVDGEMGLTQSGDQDQPNVFIIAVDDGLSGCKNGDIIEVVIPGVRNPEVAGTHAFEFELFDGGSSIGFDTATGAFIPGEVTQLAIAPSDLNELVAGEEFSVTVEARDEYENLNDEFEDEIALFLIEGEADVTDHLEGDLEVSAVEGSATLSSLSITVTGEYVLSAHFGDDIFGATDLFTVLPGPPDLEESIIMADPLTITADGESSSTITVTLKDEFGNELHDSGGVVCLFFHEDSETEGELLSDADDNGDCGDGVKAEDSENGSYMASFVGTEAGAARIAATLEGDTLTQTVTVELEEVALDPDGVVITSELDAITADGQASTALAIHFYDEDQNELVIEDEVVCLSTTLGNLSGERGDCSSDEFQAEDVGDGTYSAQLTAPTTAGTATITVASGSLSNTTTVEFRPGEPASLVIASIPPGNIEAGEPFEIDVDVLDEFGNLVDNATTEIQMVLESGPSGAGLTGAATTNAENGTARFSNLTLEMAGEYILNATAENRTSATSEVIHVLPSVDLKEYNLALQETVRVQRVDEGMEITWDPDSYEDIKDAIIAVIVWRINSPATGLAVIETGTSDFENATYLDTTGSEGATYILTLCIWNGAGCGEELSDAPGYEDQDEDALLGVAAGPDSVNEGVGWAWVVITLVIVLVAAGTVAMFIWLRRDQTMQQRQADQEYS